MSDLSLIVNGVDLRTYAWNVSSRGSLLTVPGRRGANPRRPGVHGSLRVGRRPFDENTLSLSMWAVGCNTDGSFPASPERKRVALTNLDTLTRLFCGSPSLTIQQYVDAAVYREITGATVDSAIDFSTMAGGTRAEFQVDVTVPDAFWFDSATISQAILVGSSGATLEFTSFAAATAPIVKGTYTLLGPINNPRITDVQSGQWVQLNDVVAAGTSWVVDSSAWTSMIGATNKIGVTVHGGGATFLDLTPRTPGPTVVVTGTGGITAATKLTVAAKRGYLLA